MLSTFPSCLCAIWALSKRSGEFQNWLKTLKRSPIIKIEKTTVTCFSFPGDCEGDSTDLQMKSINPYLEFHSPGTTTAKFYMKSFGNFLCIYKYMYRSILLLPPYPPPAPFFCFTQRGSFFDSLMSALSIIVKQNSSSQWIVIWGLPRWLSGKEFTWRCWRQRFDPRVGKIPSRRKWQPNPVFLPRKSHGQRSLAGYKSMGSQKEIQFSSVTQLCLTLCNPMDRSMPGLPVHQGVHPEFIQTHVHWVSNPIQPSHPLSSPSPAASNLSQHQGLSKWVSSLHQVARVLEFQLQHQSFQWTLRTDLL